MLNFAVRLWQVRSQDMALGVVGKVVRGIPAKAEILKDFDMKNDPSYNKVNTVDAINVYAIQNGISVIEANNELFNYGFLEKTTTVKGNITSHRSELTKEARQILQSGKTFHEYLKEQQEKSEKDTYHKTLQITELETKIEVMNKEQILFWNEQKARNKHLTLIAIISILLSVFALLKAWFG